MEYTSTVFLIDDDADDQEIFSYAMKEADDKAKCVFANDGVFALERINKDKSFTPDFIFIDMNMPRMNGTECLAEIKKIDRLKHVPVFMYSTNADPQTIEENKKLGAIDFIIKPSNINELANLLTQLLKKPLLAFMLLIMGLTFCDKKCSAQNDSSSVKKLKELSVEELMNVVVTSVSRSPEKLSEVASAIQVVTGDEIRRSGTLRLPGALRLASNMQVSSSGAHSTRVSSRGFNGYPVDNSSVANKLLVLIDGRSVYTPLFGGVYWDVQNVLQEDIKQIEVISGPGGSLWGANAVNGIVNVISKDAKETQGVYASAAYGGSIQDFGAVRYGSHIDSNFFYRVYVQRFDIKSSTSKTGIDAKDKWNITQGGFRMDYFPSSKSSFTLQGDLYDGTEDEIASTLVNGQNIIGRWKYKCSDKAGIMVQTYFDRTFRNIQSQKTTDELNTFDLDLQQNIALSKKNSFVWGLGYRVADDNFHDTVNAIVPARKTFQLFSGFVQDQVAIIPESVDLTFGTKIQHNDYTNFEFQPTVRVTFTPNAKNTIWASVSRAVRTPSRFEDDNSNSYSFQSEKLIAYEAGYRSQPVENISFSIASFYNNYSDVRSIDSNQSVTAPFIFANNLAATTYGIEFSARVILTNWWKLRGGYTWLQEEFTAKSPKTWPSSSSFEAIDPQNQFIIQSMMDIAKNFQLDGIIRYVDALPLSLDQPSVPSYITFDLNLAWKYKWLTLTVTGANLADKFHGSSGSVRISRSVYGRITIRI